MDYREKKGINFSTLKYFLECPAYYQYKLSHPEPPNKNFLLGDMVHTILLESDKFDEKFEVYDIEDRPDKRYTMAAKANKEWLESLESEKDLVNINEVNFAKYLAQQFFSDQFLTDLYNKATSFEQETFWDVEGVMCKGKIDILGKGWIADIKTSSATSPSEFIHKALYRYRYDFQAAMYADSQGIDTFYFLVIPKAAPFIPYTVIVSTETLRKATKEFYQAVKNLKICEERNEWPAYGLKTM